MALTGEMCLFIAIEWLPVKVIWVEVIEKRADRALTLLGCGVPCGEPMRCKERQIALFQNPVSCLGVCFLWAAAL